MEFAHSSTDSVSYKENQTNQNQDRQHTKKFLNPDPEITIHYDLSLLFSSLSRHLLQQTPAPYSPVNVPAIKPSRMSQTVIPNAGEKLPWGVKTVDIMNSRKVTVSPFAELPEDENRSYRFDRSRDCYCLFQINCYCKFKC